MVTILIFGPFEPQPHVILQIFHRFHTLLALWVCVPSQTLDNRYSTKYSVGNPAIRVYHGPTSFGPRQISPSREALSAHNINPIPLASKEHLGILNGTAFSASVAALALNDAVHLALLAQVCTALGTEALVGTRGSYAPFIHAVARPHPGQVRSLIDVFAS